jgi:hypothetical protein
MAMVGSNMDSDAYNCRDSTTVYRPNPWPRPIGRPIGPSILPGGDHMPQRSGGCGTTVGPSTKLDQHANSLSRISNWIAVQTHPFGVSIGKAYHACEEKGCRGIVAYLNFLYRTGKFLWARPGLWRSFLTTYPREKTSGPTSKVLACRTRFVISLCIVAPLHSTYRLIISL